MTMVTVIVFVIRLQQMLLTQVTHASEKHTRVEIKLKWSKAGQNEVLHTISFQCIFWEVTQGLVPPQKTSQKVFLQRVQ